MPYKCSIKDCRSNFDSTTEKVTVFSFPKDEEMLSKWLNVVELKAKNVTKSSRICIKHFSPDDVDNNFRNMLKPHAIPIPVKCHQTMIENSGDSENKLLDFSQLCDEIEDRFKHLKFLMKEPHFIAVFKIDFNDESSDINLSTRIIVNKEMKLKAINNEGIEYSGELESLQQLIDLIELYFLPSDNEFNLNNESQYNNNYESDSPFDHIIINKEEDCYVETTTCEWDEEKKIISDEESLELDENLSNDDFIEFIDPLKCENCSIIFRNPLGLQHHKKTCTQLKVIAFNCKICNENFPSILKLKIHQKKQHASVNKIKCNLCSLVLVNTASLNRHISAVHLMIRSHKCSVCNKTFATSSTRNAHEKTHEKNTEMEQFLNKNGGYCCPKCNDIFNHSHQLRNHMEKNCYQPPRKRRMYKYPCKICEKQFSTKIKAAKHLLDEHDVKIENPQKFCFECNFEVDDYSNHIRIHTCQYNCRYCGLKFLTEETCAQHEDRQHSEQNSGIRPFRCHYCTASFKTEHHLKSHITSFHVHVQKEFECDICSSRFSTRSLLQTHLRSHNKNCFIFNCKICSKSFKRLINLKNHLSSVHQIEEMYSCEIENCQERFKLLQELKIHQQAEHGVNLNIQKYFSEQK